MGDDFPAWNPNKQLFSQDQMTNPYSKFYGQALPWPTPYNLGGLSAPTDAKGNPIASYQAPQATQQWVPGTTINNTGAGLEAKGSGARAMQDAGYGDWAMLDPMMAQTSMPNPTAGAGSVGATSGWNPANPSSVYPSSGGGGGGQTTTDGSWQTVQPSAADQAAAYLNALGNPGKVTTQGATVAPSAAQYQPTSGVLDAYLSQNKTGGFADTINALRAKRQA